VRTRASKRPNPKEGHETIAQRKASRRRSRWILRRTPWDPSVDDPGDEPLPGDVVFEVRGPPSGEFESTDDNTSAQLYISEDAFEWMVSVWTKWKRKERGRTKP